MLNLRPVLEGDVDQLDEFLPRQKAGRVFVKLVDEVVQHKVRA